MRKYVSIFFNKFLNGVLFWIWFLTIIWCYIVYATYSTITPVTTWQTLTKDLFNNVISNIEDLNTRVSAIATTWNKSWSNIYYNAWNVWVWNNNPQANLDVSWTVKMLWTRTAISIWTVYQAPSDWFVLAFWRTDWNSWLLPLTLMWWLTNPPTSELGVWYSYNNWSTRLWNYQLMVPIKKWEYYQLLCSWLTTCPAPFFIWRLNAYFIPMGN